VLLLGVALHQIFLDTEGMASHERTRKEETNIVSLAGLLSSLLIYNKLGTFDDTCVNSLAKVAMVMEQLYTCSGALLLKHRVCGFMCAIHKLPMAMLVH
jgi:hypothetical protein